MTLTEITLRRFKKIFIPTVQGSTPIELIAMFMVNLNSLGYTISMQLMETLTNIDKETVVERCTEIINAVKKSLGADVEYNPMYPNFPEQVKNAHALTLYYNAMKHYMGNLVGKRLMPKYKLKDRPELIVDKELIILDYISEKDLVSDLREKLIYKPFPYNDTDREDIQDLMHYPDIAHFIFDRSISVKENLGFLSKFLLDSDHPEAVSDILKTSTDVLRCLTAYSEGDISLATNTKFVKLNRPLRRLFCSTLERVGSAEDMVKYRSKWIRIGEILHPGEARNAGKYTKLCSIFKKLRDGETIETFNSKVEKAMAEGHTGEAIKLLSTRPGEFARRLNQLILADAQPQLLIEEFDKVVHTLPPKLLIELRNYFQYRNEKQDYRFIMPKGNVAKAFALENDMPKIDEHLRKEIESSITNGLISIFAQRKTLGKVFVDRELIDYTIPFATRSGVENLKSLSRCTRLRLNEDTKIVRMFIYWKDMEDEGRVDVDLSAVAVDENWENTRSVSYTRLRDKEIKAYHSGDITSAPDGASEFIDIDIASALTAGMRYLIMNVYSFTGQPLSTIPECFAGWMERNDMQSGEVYEPLTVEQKFNLTTETTHSMPMILDLKEKTIIWMDLGVLVNAYQTNNVENSISGIKAIGKGFVETKKPNLYDLFMLHAETRGTLVEDKEEADIVFDQANREITEDFL